MLKISNPQRTLFRGLAVFLAILMVVLTVLPADALAAPGGQFAKQLFKSRAGKIIGGIVLFFLLIVLLPLILYVYVREWIGVSKTKKDLAQLADRYPYFNWAVIDQQLREAVRAIYGEWTSGDLSPVRQFMTDDYFGSQQDMLDRWKEDGRRNVVELKKINATKPLAVRVEDEESASWVRVLVDVQIIDYLEQTMTQTVLKGKDSVQDSFETIWWLIYDNDRWLVHAIEPGDGSLSWAGFANQVDTRFLDALATPSAPTPGVSAPRPAARSDSSPPQVPQNPPAANEEESSIDVGDDDDR